MMVMEGVSETPRPFPPFELYGNEHAFKRFPHTQSHHGIGGRRGLYPSRTTPCVEIKTTCLGSDRTLTEHISLWSPVSLNRVFLKHKKLPMMAIMAWDLLLRENEKVHWQNVIPVSIEPRTSAIWIWRSARFICKACDVNMAIVANFGYFVKNSNPRENS